MNVKKPTEQAPSGLVRLLATRSVLCLSGSLSRRPSAHALPPRAHPLLTKLGIPPLCPSTPFCTAHARARALRPLPHLVPLASALACLLPSLTHLDHAPNTLPPACAAETKLLAASPVWSMCFASTALSEVMRVRWEACSSRSFLLLSNFWYLLKLPLLLPRPKICVQQDRHGPCLQRAQKPTGIADVKY